MQDVLHLSRLEEPSAYGQCMEDDDPLDREEYAAGFKLDRWERFHHIKGDETKKVTEGRLIPDQSAGTIGTGPQSVVTEFIGPRTVKPGTAVPIQRAHATTAEEL